MNEVTPVGEVMAKIINFMHAEGVDCSKLISVGHSLGAHVMGIAGHATKKNVRLLILLLRANCLNGGILHPECDESLLKKYLLKRLLLNRFRDAGLILLGKLVRESTSTYSAHI